MATQHRKFSAAVKRARMLARQGPRVAAVLKAVKPMPNPYGSVPGFVDEDKPGVFRQIALVTPDGRVWECVTPTLTIAERDEVTR